MANSSPDPVRKSATLVKLLATALAAGVIVAAICLPTIGGLGFATGKSIDTFNDLPSVLKNDGKPPQRSVMVAADGSTRIANLYLQNRQVIPFDQIPKVARKAQIAIEDSRFYHHHGVDTRGVLRALLHDTGSGGSSQGGSTLTQQYVKQVLLYNADNAEEQRKATEDTIGRKLREARLALALEKKLSKHQILARYLNIAYYGSGAYGIETAAQTYFGIHASQLSLPQAALLAGLVQSPTGYDPYTHADLALKRRHVVLTRMQQQGYITKAQMREADRSPLGVRAKQAAPANGCGETLLPDTGFFCDYVRSYLRNVLHLTKTQLYNGGLIIRTTLDPDLQRRAAEAVSAAVPKDNPAAAVLDSVQPGTGKVQAMAVNRNFGVDGSDPTQTTINLGVKPVAQAGSTYKAFTVASALEKRVPFSYQIQADYTAVAPSLGYSADAPAHNDSPAESGLYDLQKATVQSVNTYFIQLLESRYFNSDLTGPVRMAQRLGMKAHSVTDRVADDVITNHRGSFTLGAVPTSPLDMADAYATFAANGKYCPPNPIREIIKPDGDRLPIKTPQCKQVLDPKVANGVNNILHGDMDSTVSYNTTHGDIDVGNDHAASGKTGTTNDSAGLWFDGYTPKYSAAVAVFNPAAPSKTVESIPGHEGEMLYGRFSADIWNAAFAPVISAEPPSSWPAPAQSVVWGDSVAVPCVVGASEVDASKTLGEQGFTSTSTTSPVDNPKPAGTVLSQSPACGARAAKNSLVQLTLSNGVKPPPPPPPKPPKPPKHNHGDNHHGGDNPGGNQPGGNQPGGGGGGGGGGGLLPGGGGGGGGLLPGGGGGGARPGHGHGGH